MCSSRTYRTAAVIVTVIAAGLLISCVPPYAEYQGARMVGPGSVEITPFYSALWTSGDGETEKIQDHVGLQLATGMTEFLDVRFRYEYIRVEGEGLSVIGAGPKLRIARDRLALYTPVGTGFGDDLETSELWQVQPALLVTLPAAQSLDVNASIKTLIWLNNDSDELVALNIGLGFRPGESMFELRPEGGYLWNPGESGHSFHFGIGLSFRSGGR